MKSIGLYLDDIVTIEQLAIVAMKCKFKTYFLEVEDHYDLGVEYIHRTSQRLGVWRIWHSEVIRLYHEEPHLLGDSEIKAFEEISPKTVYFITYYSNSMSQLKTLVENILSEFPGQVLHHDTEQILSIEQLGSVFIDSN